VNNDNQPKSSVEPSAPQLLTNLNKTIPFFKTPNRTFTTSNEYLNEKTSSTFNVIRSSNLHSEKSLNKGKLNTTPQLCDFLSPKNEPNLELVKLVAELTSNNKSKRLDSNTKKFSGSASEDVDEWLFNIEQGFISSKIRDEDKLNAIVTSLKESLLKFYENI